MMIKRAIITLNQTFLQNPLLSSDLSGINRMGNLGKHSIKRETVFSSLFSLSLFFIFPQQISLLIYFSPGYIKLQANLGGEGQW